MDYRTIAANLTTFIAGQEEIAGSWDGKNDGWVLDATLNASHLIELAQPLLDELKALIANEDFVPPQR